MSSFTHNTKVRHAQKSSKTKNVKQTHSFDFLWPWYTKTPNTVTLDSNKTCSDSIPLPTEKLTIVYLSTQRFNLTPPIKKSLLGENHNPTLFVSCYPGAMGNQNMWLMLMWVIFKLHLLFLFTHLFILNRASIFSTQPHLCISHAHLHRSGGVVV